MKKLTYSSAFKKLKSLHGKWKGKKWKQWQILFSWAPKITVDGGYSHEIKRHLLLGRKALTNLDCVLKSRDITLPTKIYIVKGMVFPVVMYKCDSWTIKKADHKRIDAFKLWCWRRHPWESFGLQGNQTSQSWRRSTLNIHWKDWFWSWAPILWSFNVTSQLWKRPDVGKNRRQKKKRAAEDEVVK